MKYVSTQWDPSTAPVMPLATNSLKMESAVQVKILQNTVICVRSTVHTYDIKF